MLCNYLYMIVTYMRKDAHLPTVRMSAYQFLEMKLDEGADSKLFCIHASYSFISAEDRFIHQLDYQM